jgi:hypothetical protein
LTPGVNEFVDTKSQPFNLINLMVENMETKDLNVCVSCDNNLLF